VSSPRTLVFLPCRLPLVLYVPPAGETVASGGSHPPFFLRGSALPDAVRKNLDFFHIAARLFWTCRRAPLPHRVYPALSRTRTFENPLRLLVARRKSRFGVLCVFAVFQDETVRDLFCSGLREVLIFNTRTERHETILRFLLYMPISPPPRDFRF